VEPLDRQADAEPQGEENEGDAEAEEDEILAFSSGPEEQHRSKQYRALHKTAQPPLQTSDASIPAKQIVYEAHAAAPSSFIACGHCQKVLTDQATDR
jgi:hypothetical protein